MDITERAAEITRNTSETRISMKLVIDGSGSAMVKSGCGFLDHMLTLFAHHGMFDLELDCAGDTYVDYHHTVEDIGIALGEAFDTALGDRRGIKRYADLILPMDEALIMTAVDISGRAHLTYDVKLPTEKVGDFDTELAREFWLGFIRASRMTLHIRELSGDNSHHIIEGIFKAAARVISRAAETDPRRADTIPSTKGIL